MRPSTGPIRRKWGHVLTRGLPYLLPTLALALACGGTSAPTAVGDPEPGPEQADVVVEAGVRHQTIDGFGATTEDLVYQYGKQDNLPPALREEAIEVVYGQVGLNMGNLWVGNIETENDDDDPTTFRWEGFRFGGVEAMKEKLVDPAGEHGLTVAYPSYTIDLRVNLAWMRDLRAADYGRYLAEAGEFVAAGVIDWQTRFGQPPRFLKLFNEPLGGNRELRGGDVSEVVDLVDRVGRRLDREGFSEVRFIVPAGVRLTNSLSMARKILETPGAAQHVGVLSYHPYGGPYNRIDDILHTSGRGRPDPNAVERREELRDLARARGLPLWMTEVSGGGAGATSMDALRGRAIHIHDEFRYAGASAYFGMINIWDSRSHRDHFGNDDLLAEEDMIALIDLETGEVITTSMGHAIGHYARWIESGAVRVEASSEDSLIQISAFRDDASGRLSTILINNHPQEQSVRVTVQGISLTGPLEGEFSAGDQRWQALDAIPVEEDGSFTLTLPGHSVVSVAGRY